MTQSANEEIFEDCKTKFGFVPNVIREMAKSRVPARLYLKAQEYLAEGVLTPQEQQAVQLAVSVENECHYCQAAHTAGGKMTGCELSDLESVKQGGLPGDPGMANVTHAARLVVRKKGWLGEDELKELEQKGIDRARLYEIITLIGLKTITNYINHIAHTPIDDELKG
ncbi:MAG: carboxymuconolactone decarboxylase family protein [Nitrospinaceae bacterium]